MTIKIIGAGFGRTGTTSLKAALEELGYGRCYHMQEVFRNGGHARQWQAAIDGEAIDWSLLFAGYQATVDWPGCSVYQTLMNEYPDAKVLLSVRDPERWYNSTFGTIYRLRSSLLMRLLKLVPRARSVYTMVEHIWGTIFDERFDDRAYAIDVFNRHNEAVVAHVAADRLLVFDVKEGWQPLCDFLGVDVPDRPFPHLNDKRLMQNAMRFGPAVILTGMAVILILAIWLIGSAF